MTAEVGPRGDGPSRRAERLAQVVDREGQPIENGIHAVTVLADAGWRAEALTKRAFGAGPARAIEELAVNDAEEIVVVADGTQLRIPGLVGTSP